MLMHNRFKQWIIRLIICPLKCAKNSLKCNSAKYAALLLFCTIALLLINNQNSSVITVEKSMLDEKLASEKIATNKIVIETIRPTEKKDSYLYSSGIFEEIRLAVGEAESVEFEQPEIETDLTQMEFEPPRNISSSSCPRFPPELIGNLSVDTHLQTTFEEIEKLTGPRLGPGGCFVPSCDPLQKVAIIIPFKDRESHLKTLLHYLHPMLMRQKSQYCIYVAEQFDNGQFNKALIMNAAFEEVMKLHEYDCIIFHDADMIPENDANMYRCGSNPIHLSPAIDKFKYHAHYGTDFGGVTAITPKQYRRANGHSNQFWGWGGEDNDMEFRIRRKGMKIVPSSLKVGRYKMIPHRHSWQFKKSSHAGVLNTTREKRAVTDGLSDIQYRMVGIEHHQSYTKIFIDIRRIAINKATLYINNEPAMDIDLNMDDCRWDKYEGKHLDVDVPVSEENLERVINLPEDEILEIPPDKPVLEWENECLKFKDKNSLEKKKCEKEQKQKLKPKGPWATVKSLKHAKRLCDALSPECRGIIEEPRTSRFLLRHSGVPRNLVVSSPVDAGFHGVAAKRYLFPMKNVYLKYCPGRLGNLQPYAKPLIININEDNDVEGFHMYKFVIDFTVLLQPDKALYYYGTPYFEAQMRQHINISPFRWYRAGKFPDFSDPSTDRNFTFKTMQFNLPNIPGCYSMECKLMGSNHSPYFKWNWWFEVRSNDKYKDALIRDIYIEKDREQRLRKLSPKLQQNLREEERVYRQQQDRKLKEKRELFFEQQLRQMSDLVVSRDKKNDLDPNEMNFGSIQIGEKAKSKVFHGFKPKDDDR